MSLVRRLSTGNASKWFLVSFVVVSVVYKSVSPKLEMGSETICCYVVVVFLGLF